jgi:hypothetical protein
MPWAFWVAKGWKPIETRTHTRFASLVGRRIAIHAGQHWDVMAFDFASQWLTPEQVRFTKEMAPDLHGYVLATAFVEAHERLGVLQEKNALIECRTPRWGLFLKEIRELETPFAAEGRQGIWKIEL